MEHIQNLAKKIRCLITDVDGVLSDGYLYVDHEGNELKAFHVQDGMGLKLLMAADIKVAVITTARNSVIDHRMQQLGVTLFYKGQVDKREAYRQIKEQLQLDDSEIAYIGDDLPDLPIIEQVGLGCAVGDAVAMVRKRAKYVTSKSGGHGAVRELCDLILEAQDKVDAAIEKYYRL